MSCDLEKTPFPYGKENGVSVPKLLVEIAGRKLHGLLDAAGTKTACTDPDAFGGSFYQSPYRTEIWPKHPFGPIVGVADIVANQTVFSTNFA